MTSELLLIAACLFFRHCCCDMLWLSFQFLQVLRWLLRCHILLGLRWCFVPLTVLLLSGSVLVACCRAAIPRDLAGHIPTFNRKIPWKIIHEGIHWSDYSLEHPAPSHPSIPKNWPRFFFFFFRTSQLSEFPWVFLWKISNFLVPDVQASWEAIMLPGAWPCCWHMARQSDPRRWKNGWFHNFTINNRYFLGDSIGI